MSYTNKKNNVINKTKIKNAISDIRKISSRNEIKLKNYLERNSKITNPYLNSIVLFSTGEMAYVTNSGILKLIQSTTIYNSLSESIKSIKPKKLNIPWITRYNTKGAEIPTFPSLIVGSPVQYGQTLGNEGKMIYVDKLLPENVNPIYVGCYSTNSTEIIKNGNFLQPLIEVNSFKQISATELNSWNSNNVTLINSSNSWDYPLPYPSSVQCISLQANSSISQLLTLSENTNYTISIDCSGKNTLNVNLVNKTSSNSINILKISPKPEWSTFSSSFMNSEAGDYSLLIIGTGDSETNSAIQNVSLTISRNENDGVMTSNDCKNMAMNGGYQYYGISNFDLSTNKGTCIYSNDLNSLTKNGLSNVSTKEIILWQSNTSLEGGNASLSVVGTLCVIDSTGKTLFSTPGDDALPSNYLGCYSDSPVRAMTMYDDASYKYNYEECKNIAIENDYSFFGLQDSTNGQNAQCALSNDYNGATKYGKATNCTKTNDGLWSGNGWSNALYSVLPQSNYFLILQDDGNMCIYRGENPSDNQGKIWCSETLGKNKYPNPSMNATKNKFGKNWMSSSDALFSNEFLSSNDGSLILKFNSNGNLCLITNDMQQGCIKDSNSNTVGDSISNAIYNLGMTSFPKMLDIIGKITPDSIFKKSDDKKIKFSNKYTKLENMSWVNSDNTISTNTYDNIDKCEKECNKKNNCSGYTFSDSVCSLKKNNPSFEPSLNSTVYMRNKTPRFFIRNPTSVDTNSYNYYIKQEKEQGQELNENNKSEGFQEMNANNLFNKVQLNILNNKLKLNSYQKEFNKTQQDFYSNLNTLKTLNNKIKLTDINSQLSETQSDSEIEIKKQYSYFVFWSMLLALSVVAYIKINKH